MKKYIIYIVGGALLLAGMILGLCGMALAGFDTDKLNGYTPYEEKLYETDAAEIERVVLEDINTRIEIVPSRDDRIHVHYFENNKMRYTVTEKNGTLSLVKRDERRWYEHIAFFDFSVFDRPLKIEIPADVPVALSVKTTNGSVSAEDFSPEALTVSTTNGNITLQNINTRDITLKTTNGSVSLKRCRTEEHLTADSTNGSVTFSDVEAPRMTLKTSNAQITLDSVTADGTISVKTSNGKITAKNVTAGEDLILETSNATVSFDHIDFEGELYCKTSNSRIEGTLPGGLSDFRYDCKTSNGSCSLPENGGSGRRSVHLKTSNADIRVSFSEE